LIDYNGTTLNDSARVWSSSIYVNVSVSETNFKNITFKLYYSNNTWINSTVFNHSAGSYAVSWTGLAGDDYKYNVSVYDLIENFNATSTRTITLIDSQSNVSLNSGWNLIALDLKDTSTGDKNISVTAGWNLIGYSSNESFDLSNAKFTNSSGTELSFSNAVSNNKLRGYMAYYDSSPSSASQRRYKYAAESSLSMDDSSFREKKGYWVYANQSGNLTLPNARGTNASRTYAWNKLRFSNGTMEKTISDAITAGWINNNLNYWDPELGWLTISDIGDKDTISSWEGVFVYSNKNNITMLRQN
jgi:hypothetical protein